MSPRGPLAGYLLTLAAPYLMLVVVRALWRMLALWHGPVEAGLNALLPDVLTLVQVLPSVPNYLLEVLLGQAPVNGLPDFVLTLAQLWLLVRAALHLARHFFPAQMGDLPLIGGGNGTGELDGARLGRPWWTLVARMAFWTLVTVSALIGLIGGLFTGQYAGQVLLNAGGWPLWISIGLAALGVLWGQRFNNSAKDVVARHLGATLLPEDHPLTQRVHALADRLALPRPAVGYMMEPNAFAVGSTPQDAVVVLGVPLVRNMKADELDAVIGHELGHIISNDMRQMQFAVGYQKFFGDLFSFAAIIGTQTAASATKSRSSAMLTQSLGDSLKDLGGVVIFLAGELTCKKLSRDREYYADAVGAGLSTPDAMARALDRITAITAGQTANENRYAYLMFDGGKRRFRPFDTHPSTEDRKKALSAGTYTARLPRK
jgi:Zn-dependent protease with chaperone function